MEHTKEPWRLCEQTKKGLRVISGVSWHDLARVREYCAGSIEKEGVANARRIVAAVNYCEGVPTSELESKGATAGFWGQACSRLQTERDKLREENTRLLAAVAEMEKMLPVLEDLHKVQRLNITQIDEPALNAYRLALQTALAKRTEP